MKNYNLFLYWENKPECNTPDLVNRCIKIFKDKCKNVVLVNDKNITDYIDIVSTEHLIHIAQKVDYYRAKLLYTYGGIWCDIDTIMLQNLDEEWENFIDSGKEACLSTSELQVSNVCIAYLMAKKNSSIFKKWFEECEKLLLNRSKLKWSCLGGTLLANIINDNNFMDLIYPFPNEITYRLGWRNSDKYYITDKNFIDGEKKKIMNKKLIILYGTYMYNKDIPENSILNYFFNYKAYK